MAEQPGLFELNPIMRGVLKPGSRRAYALAGRATMTIRNPKTEKRFTFRIRKWVDPVHKNDPIQNPLYFVSLLNGPNNEADYTYLGTIFTTGFRRTHGTKLKDEAISMQSFTWLSKNWEDPRVEVWHEGSCGRCGKKLTVPESIESGLGPVCEGASLNWTPS